MELSISIVLSIAILSILSWILLTNVMGYEHFEDVTVTGRYIKLHKVVPGNDLPLNIAEIEVYDINGVNVAKDASVTSSSVLGPFIPEWLIDGNLDNFAHTTEGMSNWFMLDLGREIQITKVVVYNRKSCCKDRIIGSRVLIHDESRKEVFKSEKISDILPIYTFSMTEQVTPVSVKINETVDKVTEKVLSVAPEKAEMANDILNKVKTLQDEADKKIVIAELAKTTDQTAPTMSQDMLRVKLEKEQAEMDAKALIENSKSANTQSKFQPARVLEEQVAEEIAQEHNIKSVDLSKDTDADDYVMIDPQYWMELNVEKPLCNFKCEIQPVVFGGVSQFLQVKKLKTSAAEKFLKK